MLSREPRPGPAPGRVSWVASAGPHRRIIHALLLLLFLALGVLLTASPALAESPFRVDSQLTDRAGALSGSEGEVRQALQGLAANEQVQLWVVYVRSFSGQDPQAWASETAQLSDLGLNDMLLAVAVEDRAYAYSVDDQFPLSDQQLADVATGSIEPSLRADDWAGAVVAGADGLSRALQGEAAPPTGGSSDQAGGGGGSSWLIWVVVLGVGALLLYVFSRRGRRPAKPAAPTVDGAGAATADPYAALSLEDLRRQANQQLVETDDAVKTSEQELAFAVAEFGDEATVPFVAALEAAKTELKAAFRLQQGLDDTSPSDETAARATLVQVLERTDAASDRLDAEADRFDELRRLKERVPEVLDGLERRLQELADRPARARSVLADLATTYAPQALATPTANVVEAERRLTFATEQVAAGRASLAAGEAGPAALDAQAAEEAIAQAVQLLEGVDRTKTELDEAGGRIQAAMAETGHDLAEARAHAGEAALAGPVAAAEGALAQAAAAASPDGGQDPLAALRRLEQADLALEQALQGVRDAETQRQRARASLQQALLTARAQIDAARDFITTRRGAVGAEARTRLAEAERYLALAVETAESDPTAALHRATTADSLAEAALQAAEADASRGGLGIPGMGQEGGGGLGGALLGGILLNTLFGGGGMGGGFGGSGGGFGGGGGGRRGGGGFFPASFGGRGTRGRGGGGRF